MHDLDRPRGLPRSSRTHQDPHIGVMLLLRMAVSTLMVICNTSSVTDTISGKLSAEACVKLMQKIAQGIHGLGKLVTCTVLKA